MATSKSGYQVECWPQHVRVVLEAELGERARQLEDALDWFFGKGRLHPEVQRYAAYLKCMGERFFATAELFDLWSPPNSMGTKHSLRLTRPEELLYIANQLYVLDSEGVPGVVLECGCAHGYSSACLSMACAYLNRPLVVADSFEGLPDVDQSESFFRKGDYASTEDEVMRHIRFCGHADVVRFVKGWYKDSLRNWNEPIALLWMDVDLFESARDLLAHVLPAVDPKGLIFTHEFTDFHGVPQPLNEHNVPSAIHAAFERLGYPYHAELLCRYWGVIGRQPAGSIRAHVLLDALWSRLSRMDERWRLYDETRHSTTVKAAFAVKNMLMPWKK